MKGNWITMYDKHGCVLRIETVINHPYEFRVRLQRAVEKKLKQAGLDLSAREALRALHTVKVVDIDLGERGRKRGVARGSSRAAVILNALGITELEPPSPPKGQETLL